MRMETYGEKPSPRERCSLINVNEEFLVLFGGYICSKDYEVHVYYNDLFTLNLSTLCWNKIPLKGEIPQARYGHSVNIYKRKLYLFGGVIRTDNENDWFDIFNENFYSINIFKCMLQ